MEDAAETSSAGWSHFPHVADVGIEGRGPTLEVAFEQAALALTAVITTAGIKPATKVEVNCEARDHELLFVDWLNAIIYEMAVRDMIFGRFDVHIAGSRLNGTLWGERIDPVAHEPACEPKGATYTALKVAKDDKGVWTARCVVDV